MLNLIYRIWPYAQICREEIGKDILIISLIPHTHHNPYTTLTYNLVLMGTTDIRVLPLVIGQEIHPESRN